METKTHYRKVFKSDHLGVADLEDLIEAKQKLVFTIKEVKQEINILVAGRKGNHNIAYFKENIKPLVLNAGNSKIMRDFNKSPFVENWSNTVVELYIQDGVKFGHDTTSGVRIRKVQPKTAKPELTPKMSSEWNRAISHLNKNGTIDDIKKRYILSYENEQKLKTL